MSLNLTYYSYLMILGFFISILLDVYAWRSREKRGAMELAFLASGIGIWSLGYAFELGAIELTTKILWAKVEYLGIVAVPLAWLLLVLRYTRRERFITRRNLCLLGIIPLVTLVFVWTNEAHRLVWASTTLNSEGSFLFLVLDYGPWFWINWVYSYLVLLTGTLLLGSMFSRSPRAHLGQRAALLVTIFTPWLGNFVYVLNFGPLPNLDFTPFGFLLSTIALTFGLLRFQFLDLIPVAHRLIIESMAEKVMVIDLENRVVEINPAAQRILKHTAESAVGQSATRIVPGWSSLLEDYQRNGRTEGDIRIGDGLDQRTYDPILSLLKDSKGRDLGYLLALHDVTERKRSEDLVRELNEDLEKRVSERTQQLEIVASELRDREQALLQSEEYFRSLLQNASDIISVVDAGGTILYESPSVEQILGHSPEKMLGTNALDYVHPEDLDEVTEALRGRASTNYVRPPLEFRFRTREGSWRCLEVVASNQLDNPSVGGIVINSRDVTERKRAEERYRGIFENAVEGIFQVSQDGLLSTANPSMARILGYESAEYLIENVPQAREFFVDPEHGARFFKTIQEQGSVAGFESQLRRKDGGIIWASKSARALYDSESKVVCYEGSIEDITEKKLAQQNIQRSLDILLALHGAGQVLGSTLQVEEIDARVLETMQHILDLTTVVISTQDKNGELRIWRSVGLQSLWPKARYGSEAETARRQALKDGYRSFRLKEPGPAGKYLKGLCLPMRTEDKTIGVLEAYGKNMVESEAVGVLGSLANQAASALENARLYKELSEREGKLQDLVGKLIAAQEEERRRVAYEVHDGLAQVAAAAHQHLQAFARRYKPEEEDSSLDISLISGLVRRTVTEARQIIANLRPTTLDDFGLAAAVSQEIETLRDDGYQVEYLEDVGEERLPDEIEITLFRITQEAITNIRKHARTQRVKIDLTRQNDEAHLEVNDWGSGFNISGDDGEGGPGERVGIVGMRERIDFLGGNFEIDSQPGQGTVVRVSIPLQIEAKNLGIGGKG